MPSRVGWSAVKFLQRFAVQVCSFTAMVLLAAALLAAGGCAKGPEEKGQHRSAEVAVRAGIRFIQFAVRPEEDAVAIDRYMQALAAEGMSFTHAFVASPACGPSRAFLQARCGTSRAGIPGYGR